MTIELLERLAIFPILVLWLAGVVLASGWLKALAVFCPLPTDGMGGLRRKHRARQLRRHLLTNIFLRTHNHETN